MDKKKVGIAVGCAAVAAVIAICAVMFGGKKGDAAEPAATVETAATAEPAATPEATATPEPCKTMIHKLADNFAGVFLWSAAKLLY